MGFIYRKELYDFVPNACIHSLDASVICTTMNFLYNVLNLSLISVKKKKHNLYLESRNGKNNHHSHYPLDLNSGRIALRYSVRAGKC